MVLNRHCIRRRSPALKEALAARRKDSLKASAPESPSSAHRGLSRALKRAFGSTAARRRNRDLLMLLGSRDTSRLPLRRGDGRRSALSSGGLHLRCGLARRRLNHVAGRRWGG